MINKKYILDINIYINSKKNKYFFLIFLINFFNNVKRSYLNFSNWKLFINDFCIF